MKEKLKALYKGLTCKRNLRTANTAILILICIYSVRTYFVKQEIRDYLQKVEVLKTRQNAYIEGVSDGVLGKNDQKIIKVLSEKINQPE